MTWYDFMEFKEMQEYHILKFIRDNHGKNVILESILKSLPDSNNRFVPEILKNFAEQGLVVLRHDVTQNDISSIYADRYALDLIDKRLYDIHAKNFYEMRVICSNCGQDGGKEFFIMKGTSFKDWSKEEICSNCGVKGMYVNSSLMEK